MALSEVHGSDASMARVANVSDKGKNMHGIRMEGKKEENRHTDDG